MTRYQYEFVRIHIKGMLVPKPEEDYWKVIDKYAENGWRFVQLVGPITDANGTNPRLELIFEKENFTQ